MRSSDATGRFVELARALAAILVFVLAGLATFPACTDDPAGTATVSTTPDLTASPTPVVTETATSPTPVPITATPTTDPTPTVTLTPPPTPPPTPTVEPDPDRPNVLFILVDDLDRSLVNPRYMPNLDALLRQQGAEFKNFFVDVSICCPSRSSFLRGQYMHNTGIYSNVYPGGGFQKFFETGLEESTVATWMDAAGYRTALIGKYLNGYAPEDNPLYIPPGWDEWFASSAGSPQDSYNYVLNENGVPVVYGDSPSDYITDVLSQKASGVIRRAVRDQEPFFIYLAPDAPHQPARPAPRYEDALGDVVAPRPPSFDEADVSDKPAYVRERPPVESHQVFNWDVLYRNRARSMLAVDDMIGSLVVELERLGELDNTYIIFTSDNGFHVGQHRLAPGKFTPYEEDIHLPLFVRGPGIEPGSVLTRLALNTDIAPTVAEIGGATTPDFVDGRSLLPLLHQEPVDSWRTGVLYEQGAPGAQAPLEGSEGRPAQALAPRLRALRGLAYIYVEYSTGEREYYDLKVDPYELNNAVDDLPPGVVTYFSQRVAELSACRGVGCHDAEDRTPFP